jgi:heat shock protein HslJ
MKKYVFVLLALLILSACSSGNSASVTGTWKLVSYGPASSQTPAAADVDTSIEFKDGQVNGNVGCNGFGGDYRVDGDKLTFGSIVSTMMFCEGPVGDQESGTLAVLKDTTKFTLDGDTLTIISADGSSTIVLARK